MSDSPPRKLYNVAVVGATGVVGQEFLKIMTGRRFPVGERFQRQPPQPLRVALSLNLLHQQTPHPPSLPAGPHRQPQ